ncbi:hypothetical protein [Geothrix fuzhouensis]|uniref:hypothetical protein n=1 Tax=Geothrix fuzhouensis TaxID=2966451 RepID=UPI002149051D|nr:hypothetical protein [Geothrix fuzhouensis]
MSQYGLTLNAPIATNITAMKAAYEDPATGVAAIPAVAKVKCIGLFVDDTLATAGEAAIQTAGVAPAVAGGALNINDSVATDNQGRMVVAAGAGGEKVWCVGFARNAVTTAGDTVDILIHPHQVVI